MAQNTIRVGLVGNPERAWMGSAHLPALRALDGFEVTAVCTTRSESANAAARRFGIPHAFADPGEMARHPDVDLVVVSVKVPSHYAPVTAALEAGKDVFCEWPLGNGTAEAVAMAELARRKGARNAIGLQSRAAPALVRLKDLVAEGYVGRVMSCTLLSSNAGRGLTIPQDKAWTADASQGLSALTVGGGHSFDAVRYCLGELADVSATVSVQHREQTVVETGATVAKNAPDQVVASGTLRGGAVFSIHVQYGIANATGLWFEVNGTEGDLVLSSAEQTGIQMARLTLRGARRGDVPAGAQLPELAIPASYRWVPAAVPDGPPLNVAQAYARLASAPDFAVAVDLHRVLDAVQRASDTGERQTVA